MDDGIGDFTTADVLVNGEFIEAVAPDIGEGEPAMSSPARHSSTTPGLLIDNADGSGSEQMTVVSPFGGEPLATLKESSRADVDAAIASAQKAFEGNPLVP
ncbi:aldehyde dehydrogenase family protein [Streptomyces sp. NPDC051104]|uniref:aldehyde dehydrogenase family protein n=1 Tax=Streptomyces sp. NPDC051104 TaxID=3155044 RepID=UPI00344901D8